MSKIYGVNLAGAEFAPGTLPGALGVDYSFPTDSEFAYYASKGIKLFRLPFLWERVQRGSLWSLDAYELHRGLYAALDAAQAHGCSVIIEPHNYGRYFGRPLTTAQADINTLRDFWAKLVEATTAHPAVYGYEVFANEPHDLPGDPQTTWRLTEEARAAVRLRTGKHIILAVPGWQSARFIQDNAAGFIRPNDPNCSLGFHVYGDGGFQGTYGVPYAQDVDQGWPKVPVSVSTMSDRLQFGIDWAKTQGMSLFVTECGVPQQPEWIAMFDRFLTTIDNAPNVIGALVWAGGPRWASDYPLNLEPVILQDKPQIKTLLGHLGR